jgi:hypothetical protein
LHRLNLCQQGNKQAVDCNTPLDRCARQRQTSFRSTIGTSGNFRGTGLIRAVDRASLRAGKGDAVCLMSPSRRLR